MLNSSRSFLVSALTLLTLPVLSNAQVQFGSPQHYLTGDATRGIAVGDFNQDGKSDCATTNFDPSSPLVSVLINQGNGQFAPAVPYSMGSGKDIALCDFNRDKKPDLIALDNSGTLTLLRNTGEGVFVFTTLSVGANTTSMEVADLDKNGTEDIAVCADNGGVSLLRGNGMGGFAAPVVYATPATPLDIAIADFNNDNRLDLVVTTSAGVGILRQQNDGTFASPAALYQAGPSINDVKTGDFNRDGKADVVVLNSTASNGQFHTLLGNGNGTLRTAVPYVAGGFCVTPAVDDFNADGILDIAITNYSHANVSIFLGNGNGTFQNARTTPTAVALYSIGTGDFDGDGRLDIVTGAADQRSVLLFPNNSSLYTLSGTVTLEDCADPEQLVTVELRPTSYLGTTITRKVVTTASRAFQVSGIPSGRYDVSVKVTGWLRRTQSVNLTHDVVGFAAVLAAGDTNSDNSVDVLDLDILVRNFDRVGDP
jgi:hypothetical protein